MKNSESDVTITIRMLMAGKEIGAIIGKGGNVIASFREKSGAKINIPTAHGAPERIVTVTGYQSQVVEAFELIAEKLEQELNANVSTTALAKVPISLKFIVPASQCGSIIGRGGNKIKEIRDFPAKSATVPYKPQPANPPVIYRHGQAYTLQGNYAVPHPEITKLRHLAAMHSYTEDSLGGLLGNFTRLTGERSCGKFDGDFDRGSSGCVNLPTKIVDADTQEITVSNEVIGCIIGKYGSRINEIRAMSGAQISIDRSFEKDSKKERTITVTGSPEEISLAQYLINTSIQLFSHPSKQTKPTPNDEGPSTTTPQPLMSLTTAPSNKPIPISQLMGFMSPGPFGRPGLAGPYPGAIGMGPSASFNAAMQSARHAFMNRSRYPNNMHSRSKHPRRAPPKKETESQASDAEGDESPTAGDSSPNGKEKRKVKREKFQPY